MYHTLTKISIRKLLYFLWNFRISLALVLFKLAEKHSNLVCILSVIRYYVK